MSLQVEENGCLSDVVSHLINIVPDLVPPIVPCSQNTSEVVFSWTLDPTATGSVVNVLSGHIGNLNGSTYSFNGLNPGDIVQLEIISLENGPCPERKDTFECEAKLCPPVVLNVSPVADLCLYQGIPNIALEVTVTNGNGLGDWNGSGITDVANGIFSPTIAGSGSHLITYHYLDDGCDFFESIMINVSDVPTALISNTDLAITCASGALYLDGSGSLGTQLSYQWTTADGSIASDENSSIAEVIQPGIYQLLVMNSPSGCRDSVSVIVTQDSNIPVSDAGQDKTITCESTQITLGGSSSTGMDIIYQWSTMAGNIIGATDAIDAVADRTGEYFLIVHDTITGCQSQDNVLVSIDTVVASITLTPGDTINCNTPTSITTASLDEPLSDYIFDWTTIDGLISGIKTEPDIEVSQGGTYTLRIHNIRNGCEGTENVFVAESDEIIDAVIVDQKNITCYGDSDGSLSVNSIVGGVPDYLFSWSVGSAGIPALNSLPPGSYSLTVSDANGCLFIKEFSLVEPDLLSLELGSDRIVTEGDTVRINFVTNLPGNVVSLIEWEEYEGVSCTGCTIFEFVAMKDAIISAMITDTAGCAASDSLRLTVIVPRIVFVPTIFSPNNDGINDYFTISGKRNLTNIASLRIFDRWGNQLFETTDIQPGIPLLGWDGTFNSKPVQPGVYVYRAELDYEDVSEMVSGNITLVR